MVHGRKGPCTNHPRLIPCPLPYAVLCNARVCVYVPRGILCTFVPPSAIMYGNLSILSHHHPSPRTLQLPIQCSPPPHSIHPTSSCVSLQLNKHRERPAPSMITITITIIIITHSHKAVSVTRCHYRQTEARVSPHPSPLPSSTSTATTTTSTPALCSPSPYLTLSYRSIRQGGQDKARHGTVV